MNLSVLQFCSVVILGTSILVMTIEVIVAHSFGRGRLERQGVQTLRKLFAQQLIHHTVLLYPALAIERTGLDGACEVCLGIRRPRGVASVSGVLVAIVDYLE